MGAVVQAAFENVVTERYEALLQVSQTLISSRCSEELLSSIARELRKVINFYYLGVGIYDEKAHQVRLKMFCESGAPIQAPELAPEDAMTWWVYQHQRPLLVASLDEETRFPVAVELLKELGIRSICALPLTTVHRRLGGLAVGCQEADAYSTEEVRFLSLVANQMGLAIDDCLNLEASQRAQEEVQRKQAELQRERDRLQLLLDITNQVVSNLELRDLLRAISSSVRRVMQCDAVGVILPNAEGQQLQVYALDFPESNGLINEENLIPIDKSLPGTAFRTGEAVVINQRQLAEVEPQSSSVATFEGIRSCCFMPLVSRNRSVGVLTLGRREGNAFSQDEVDFLTQVASQVAIAVENAST